VNECGRRGALGADDFLLAACVTRSSFGLRYQFRPTFISV